MKSWFVMRVNVASVTGVDSYGKPSFGAPRVVPARVEGQRKLIRSPTGEEAVSNFVVWTDQPIQLSDRVWPPGANTAAAEGSLKPLSVKATPDKRGSRTLYRVDL